ncbi:hypothetical protein E2C01_005818 [Portunus trituberculatus]|uniref:Uncharacterized protein n=1 Tax=Portunus trituberculatus TaxID=210409 RepID=A0A5B7CVA1_PORTR|nr:hypothetical protein [Portunus trituberculatus]
MLEHKVKKDAFITAKEMKEAHPSCRYKGLTQKKFCVTCTIKIKIKIRHGISFENVVYGVEMLELVREKEHIWDPRNELYSKIDK